MIAKRKTAPRPRYERKSPQQTGPNRRVGGFYRSAEGPGAVLGGVPLNDVNAALISAVRMGYKVAEAQIDRSERMAARLRKAGDQAVGPGSDRKALDATEQLVFRTMMSGLGWLEGLAAAEHGSPVKRLIEAQYRLMGAMLGLAPSEKGESDATPSGTSENVRSSREAAYPAAQSVTAAVQIRHTNPKDERRPIRVARLEFAGATKLPGPVKMKFFSDEDLESQPLEAEFSVTENGTAMLSIATRRLAPVGRWSGAICDGDGLQLGLVEIML